MSEKVKIILVDDHVMVANAIATLIEESSARYQVIKKVSSGEMLLEFLKNNPEMPDIILLDLNMPGIGGFKTMEILREKYAQISVLALSMNQDETSIIKILKLGACGYVSKFSSETELLIALEKVISTGEYYGEEVAKILHRNLKAESKSTTVQITEREKEVLALMASELTYKEIGDKMNLSPKTIDGHRESLFQKLQVKSRVGLAIFALKNGYV